jgi:hypothetical protein
MVTAMKSFSVYNEIGATDIGLNVDNLFDGAQPSGLTYRSIGPCVTGQ